MAKRIEPIFSWDPETGVSTAIIIDGDRQHIGIAKCAPEDRDMMGEKTGGFIAECRAEIEYFKSIRDNELKPTLKAYKTLYYTINQSKFFSESSYENRMLQRKIETTAFELTVINDMINQTKSDLKTYMDTKTKTWAKLRAMRNNGQN